MTASRIVVLCGNKYVLSVPGLLPRGGGGCGGTLVFYIYIGYAYFVGSEVQYFLWFQNKCIYFGGMGEEERGVGYGSFLHATQIILCCVVDNLTSLTQ